MNCENCGLPPGALISKGHTIQVIRRAENSFKRDKKINVWVCSDACKEQAIRISKWGRATHKWPTKSR